MIEPAPAKINLDLLVTGRRADGYHELDSIVVFAPDLADRLAWAGSGEPMLRVEGPFAADVPVEGNLVARAHAAFVAATHRGAAARLVLEKVLPVAAGLGGGSADAAAALRMLDRLAGTALGVTGLAELGRAIGADVPACVHARALRMRGLGERLTILERLPALSVVLVNPAVRLATGPVFAGLARFGCGRPRAGEPPSSGDAASFVEWLGQQRNDLEAPAIAACPIVARVLAAIGSQRGCRLARMTGSGPTCFGLFLHDADAARAAAALAAAEPGWWVRRCAIGSVR